MKWKTVMATGAQKLLQRGKCVVMTSSKLMLSILSFLISINDKRSVIC